MIAIVVAAVLAVGTTLGLAVIFAALVDVYAHWRAGSSATGTAVVAAILTLATVAIGLSAALLVAGVVTGATT